MLECAAANAAQTKLRATEGAQLRLKTYVRRNAPMKVKSRIQKIFFSLFLANLISYCGSSLERIDPESQYETSEINFFVRDDGSVSPVSLSTAIEDGAPGVYIQQQLDYAMRQIPVSAESQCSLSSEKLKMTVTYSRPSALGNICMFAIPLGQGPQYSLHVLLQISEERAESQFSFSPFVSWSLMEGTDALRFRNFLYEHLNDQLEQCGLDRTIRPPKAEKFSLDPVQ